MNIADVSLLFLLVPSTVLDIKYKKVWIPIVIIFFIEAIVLNFAGINEWTEFFLGMLPGVFLFLVSKVTNEAIGLGDVYLILVMGGLVGLYKTIIILTGAMFLCAIAGLFLMFFRHWGRKKTIPFVPFLLAGSIAEVFIQLKCV